MAARRNKIIEVIEQGKPAFGGAFHAGEFAKARSYGDSDLDYVMVDLEHEGEVGQLGDTFQWMLSRRRMIAEGNPFPSPTPIVRLPHHASERIRYIATQALDYGALGIVLPYTETAEDVEFMVETIRYPRKLDDGEIYGERRVWPKAAARYWGCEDYDEYFEMAEPWPLVDRGEVLLFAMVASQTALRNIDAIAAVPGLSGILYGAKHAWSALGRRGKTDLEDPELNHFRLTVLKACRNAGLVAGTSLSGKAPGGGPGVVDVPFLRRAIDEGYQFFLTQHGSRPKYEDD